ncbi:hypothetical protein AAFF_G00298160 [Aldrovandia affinis]|uniref:Uncharacterized protein n=1 Tax=Aldrovandia affinis TaxID=143900 RepID=A0AAD7R8Q9_9TELE|nr:hypothetical protein AAFF_G00298160 [Aldrovandia affinis]
MLMEAHYNHWEPARIASSINPAVIERGALGSGAAAQRSAGRESDARWCRPLATLPPAGQAPLGLAAAVTGFGRDRSPLHSHARPPLPAPQPPAHKGAITQPERKEHKLPKAPIPFRLPSEDRT